MANTLVLVKAPFIKAPLIQEKRLSPLAFLIPKTPKEKLELTDRLVLAEKVAPPF